jgi:SAM-dependent methyltransferase
VGSATELHDLVPAAEHGTFDYVVSSHNFEHLANPIRFLQGVEAILKPGGALIMAVPDARATFDYFRPNTMLGEWLEALREKRQKPSPRQLFDFRAYLAIRNTGEGPQYAFSTDVAAREISVLGDLSDAFGKFTSDTSNASYEDAHCTVMTPHSLRLLLEECRFLGLCGLQVVEMTETVGSEFVVRLRKPVSAHSDVPDPAQMQMRRTHLMRLADWERRRPWWSIQVGNRLAKWRLKLRRHRAKYTRSM